MRVGPRIAGTLVPFVTIGLLLTGCAQTPLAPTVQVLPGQGKSFDDFASDQTACKTYAAGQVKGMADAANQQAVGTALLAGALGAGTGAAAGSTVGEAGQGAAVGGAAGTAAGIGLAAAQSSEAAQPQIQAQYDNAYAQCMYAKGDLVPGFAPPTAVATGPTGTDRALVRSIQSELARLNYLHGAADGMAGPMTHAAIRAYETDHHLAATGMVTSSLLAELQSTPTSAGAATTAAAAPSPSQWVTPASATMPAGGSPPPAAAPGTTTATTTATAPAAGSGSGWVTPSK